MCSKGHYLTTLLKDAALTWMVTVLKETALCEWFLMWNSTNTRGIQKLLFHHCAPVLCQALTHLVCLLACLLKMLPFLSESPWWSPGTRLASCWSLWATETNNGTSWRTSTSGTCRTASCPLSCRRTLTSVYQTSHSSNVCHSGRLALINKCLSPVSDTDGSKHNRDRYY